MHKTRIMTEQNKNGQWYAWLNRRLVPTAGIGPTRMEAIKDLMHKLAAEDYPASAVHDPEPEEESA
jgi:hypothetical protein